MLAKIGFDIAEDDLSEDCYKDATPYHCTSWIPHAQPTESFSSSRAGAMCGEASQTLEEWRERYLYKTLGRGRLV